MMAASWRYFFGGFVVIMNRSDFFFWLSWTDVDGENWHDLHGGGKINV